MSAVPLGDPCPFCGEASTHDENCPVVSTPYEFVEPRPDMGEPGGYQEIETIDEADIPF